MFGGNMMNIWWFRGDSTKKPICWPRKMVENGIWMGNSWHINGMHTRVWVINGYGQDYRCVQEYAGYPKRQSSKREPGKKHWNLQSHHTIGCVLKLGWYTNNEELYELFQTIKLEVFNGFQKIFKADEGEDPGPEKKYGDSFDSCSYLGSLVLLPWTVD